MGIGCGCGCSSGKKKDVYKCDACGMTSEQPKDCCGKPMKKQK